MTRLRSDLQVIANQVATASNVLDIGCGDGALLTWLKEHKLVKGRGIELSQSGVNACVAKGLSVIQGDADTDLQYYPDKAFDYVILSQTLQALRDPKKVLEELTRISRYAVVSVPNFGHIKNRIYLLLKGRMPVTRTLAYQWFDTPNIHFCTIRDFIVLCESMGLTIERRLYATGFAPPIPFKGTSWLANLFGIHGVFVIASNKKILC
jgi:methionine biosynthesis protein MetW